VASLNIADMLKYMIRIALALLSFITALAFVEGLRAYSFNIYSLLAFCVVWWLSIVLVEEIELEGKKLLISLGVPAFLTALGIVFLELALAYQLLFLPNLLRARSSRNLTRFGLLT
jgi:hypothetical protein